MKSLISILLLSMLMFSSSFAQSKKIVPENDFSIGIEMNTADLNHTRKISAAFGPTINYAIDKDFHVGTRLGFAFISGYEKSATNSDVDGYTKFTFAPYGRYFFKSIRNMRPFIKGEFELTSDLLSSGSTGETKTESTTNLNLSAGGAWYPFNNVGVYAGVRFFNFNIDDKFWMAGIGNTYLGIEWYL